MSFYEKYKNPPPLSHLRFWKRFVFFVALASGVLMASISLNKNLTIYGTAPDHPVPETGQVYAVNAEHGSIRYLSASEEESNELWGDEL